MVACLQFPLSLWQPLQCCRFDLLKSTESGGGIGQVNNFFSELEDAIAVLDSKRSLWRKIFNVQRLIPLRGRVSRSFRQMHGEIFHGLPMRPKLANPWQGEFYGDMSLELFGFSEDSIKCWSFGQWCRERNTHSLIANIRNLMISYDSTIVDYVISVLS